MLYRGVNKLDDEKNGGRLLPKGNVATVVPLLDGKWRLDGSFRYGPCEANTARAHQIDSGLYGGSGISTSRSEETAIHFATSGRTEEGYVYVIDEASLQSANVAAHEFADPLHPHEVEVTLIEKSGLALPACVVHEKYAVTSEGKKI